MPDAGGGARLWARPGFTLWRGTDTVTLPQFRLSARALHLRKLRVTDRELARATETVLTTDRRLVAQMQGAYNALYAQLEESVLSGGLAESPVRDSAEASALLRDVSRSTPLQPSQAMRTHSRKAARMWVNCFDKTKKERVRRGRAPFLTYQFVSNKVGSFMEMVL